jgi:hypothetical protein
MNDCDAVPRIEVIAFTDFGFLPILAEGVFPAEKPSPSLGRQPLRALPRASRHGDREGWRAPLRRRRRAAVRRTAGVSVG